MDALVKSVILQGLRGQLFNKEDNCGLRNIELCKYFSVPVRNQGSPMAVSVTTIPRSKDWVNESFHKQILSSCHIGDLYSRVICAPSRQRYVYDDLLFFQKLHPDIFIYVVNAMPHINRSDHGST